MNGLRSKKVEYYKVDYDDLRRFIIANLNVPRDYSIIAEEEWGNDSEHAVTVGGRYALGGEEAEKLEAELAKGKAKLSYRIGDLMDLLYRHGLIEAGEYLIDVCW